MVVVCAVGYSSVIIPSFLLRTRNIVTRRRLSLQHLIFTDETMKQPVNTLRPSLSAATYRRCLDACRWSPLTYNAQPTRAVALMESGEE